MANNRHHAAASDIEQSLPVELRHGVRIRDFVTALTYNSDLDIDMEMADDIA